MRLEGINAKQFRWETVVALSKDGKTQTEIGNLLQLCQSSVSRILQQYRSQGEVKVKINAGAECRLNEGQKGALRDILVAGSVCYGFEGEYWTNKRVLLVIKEQFGIGYQVRQISNILQKLGFSKQRFSKVDARQSAEKLAAWKASELPALKKKVLNKDAL